MAEVDGRHHDVAGYLLGTLDPGDADAFARHLAECRPCQAELADLEWLADLPIGIPIDEPLPTGLEDATFAAIERAATAPSAHPGTPMAPPLGRRRRGAVRHRRRGPDLRRRPVLITAAAVVVAVIVTVTLAVGSTTPSPGKPAVTAIELAATNRSAASGTAVLKRTGHSLAVDMRLQHLPPSAPGSSYTCWLVAPDDTSAHHDWLALGTFTVGRSGTVTLHWLTPDLYQHPRITITSGPSQRAVLATV